MEIMQLQRSHLEEVVSLWNNAIEVQRQGYQTYTISCQRLMNIMEDENFLPSGALVAVSKDRLVGFALGMSKRRTSEVKVIWKRNPDGWLVWLYVQIIGARA